VDDEPIYRQTFYTQNLNEPDIFIQHTNTDEIKDVFNAQRAIDILRTRKINGEENPAIEI
jgi:predicted esterase